MGRGLECWTGRGKLEQEIAERAEDVGWFAVRCSLFAAGLGGARASRVLRLVSRRMRAVGHRWKQGVRMGRGAEGGSVAGGTLDRCGSQETVFRETRKTACGTQALHPDSDGALTHWPSSAR